MMSAADEAPWPRTGVYGISALQDNENRTAIIKAAIKRANESTGHCPSSVEWKAPPAPKGQKEFASASLVLTFPISASQSKNGSTGGSPSESKSVGSGQKEASSVNVDLEEENDANTAATAPFRDGGWTDAVYSVLEYAYTDMCEMPVPTLKEWGAAPEGSERYLRGSGCEEHRDLAVDAKWSLSVKSQDAPTMGDASEIVLDVLLRFQKI